MTKKAYLMFNIATGLLKVAVLAAIVLWLLPLWGINIPIWGIILLTIAFVIYEIVTYRLGWRALKRKSSISLKTIVGSCGKATTPLTPKGYVQVQGELWQALCSDRHIDKGDDIVVLEVNRLTLRVAPWSGIVMTTSDMDDTKLN
ncbi:NfeD family protein [Chloroflexota bacterium]